MKIESVLFQIGGDFVFYTTKENPNVAQVDFISMDTVEYETGSYIRVYTGVYSGGKKAFEVAAKYLAQITYEKE